jgi:hypothetical protein
MKNKEWKTFSLGDENIFNLNATLNGIDKNKLIDDGDKVFPYVTRTKNSNGLDMFVSKQPSPINKGNVIIIGLDTQTVFYQEADFYTGQNVQILSNKYLTKNIAMFLIPIIKKQLEVLNWGGNGATLGRLKKKMVNLPVTENGTPDWTFMEDYVQIKSNQIKDSYQLPRLHEITDFRGLDEVEWAEFLVSDYFDVNKPQKNPDKPLPYISAKKDSNGYNYWAHSPKNFYTKNTISWNKIGDGGGGLAYYHQYDYSMDDINCMSIKSKDGLEKYSNLFIVRMLSQYFKVFTHGHPLTKGRFMRSKMMLPAKDDKPDFAFMEQYMKRLENEVMRKWK